MRRPRGLLIGLAVALTASVAAVVGAAAPAFATVSGVVVSPLSPTEGTALPNTTTVMHFSSNTPDISSLSATIDWGDGTGATPGSIAATGPATYSVQGGHTYTDEGSFTVTVTVNDSSDASSGAGVTTATVAEGDSLTADSPLTITLLEGNNFK